MIGHKLASLWLSKHLGRGIHLKKRKRKRKKSYKWSFDKSYSASSGITRSWQARVLIPLNTFFRGINTILDTFMYHHYNRTRFEESWLVFSHSIIRISRVMKCY